MDPREMVPIKIMVEECPDVRCPPDQRVRVRAEKMGKEEIYYFPTKAEAVQFCTKELIGTPEQFLDKLQELVKPEADAA